MAGLADDWKVNRQICIDVLCAYLRMPYEPDPGEDAPGEDGPIEKRLAFQAAARSVTPSSGSSPTTSTAPHRYLGAA